MRRRTVEMPAALALASLAALAVEVYQLAACLAR
jgi:hypothetical protein